jgi:uncharacterized protein YmfQ (DUF2313 family)
MDMLDRLLALDPPGDAYPRDRDSGWAALLTPLAHELTSTAASAARLPAEVDPRGSAHSLTDFERVLGDDPCLGPSMALPLAMRAVIAHRRWTARGGTSRAFFVALAAAVGVAITIEESRPFETGVSACGDEMVPEDGRFDWIVHLPMTQVLEAESGVLETGAPMGDLVRSPIECLIRAAAPAHTDVYFSYGGV